MDIIEKRAFEKFPVCACDIEFEEEYFKPQHDFYINVAKEQREIDVDKACEWLEKCLPNIEYITNASAFRQDKEEFIASFKQAMKGE